MVNQTVRKVAFVAMLNVASCGAKTGLNEPMVESRVSSPCIDSLAACMTRPMVVSSTMLPASTDTNSKLNGADVPSQFTSSVVNGVATATVTFAIPVRVDSFNPTNQVGFPTPGPTPNYLEPAAVLELTPERVRLSFGSNSRPIQMGGERVYKCLRFRVGDSSTPSLVNFGVFDSDNQNLGNGSVAAGDVVTFTASNRRLFLGNYEPEAVDRFGFVLFANVVEITNGPITVNSRLQPAITGSISSEGNQVNGFSVSIRNGNFTDCQ